MVVKKNVIFRKTITVTVDIVFWLSMLIVAYLCLQIFFFTSFKIPSDSMSPSLQTGDNILVYKLIPGASLFNLFASIQGEQVDIYRMPGIRKIRRNEVVVFNFPHPKNWDKIEMHIMKYYVKRCIGLPGDTLSIRKGMYEIQGMYIPLGNRDAQKRIALRDSNSFEKVVFNCFPFDTITGWNIKEFGPLYIPKKGDVVAMNRMNYLLYKKPIEWEQKAVFEYKDSVVYLDGKAIHSYTFQRNYYFVAGDHTEDSRDSHYWGLLPEEYIVGKAWIIWKSTDLRTDKFRWERFFKAVK
jgi:signal peptidase I